MMSSRPVPFASRSATFRGGFSLAGPVTAVFELFSPLGERRWVPGWSPELLHPPGVFWERGLIFRTREERGEAIWVVTMLDHQAHAVEYHRVEPGRYVARVTVECSAETEGVTAVRTAYRFIGLSEAGNAEIALMTGDAYREKMERWRGWLGECLSREAPGR